MMEIVLILGSVCCVVLVLGALIWWNYTGGSSASSSGPISASVGTLQDDAVVLLPFFKGENFNDVKNSGYFDSMYPGVTIVNNGSLPSTTPAFLFTTDASGTITNISANSVPYSSDSSLSGSQDTTAPGKKLKKK